MIALRRLQPSFGDGMIAEEVADLWEPWLRHADRVLEDETLLAMTQEELSKRIPKSKTRGRPGTTAEVVLRMLLLKHVRGFTFEELTREVRSSLVYRAFTRVGAGKVPDEKTMGRLARQLAPAFVKRLHERFVGIALQEQVVRGAKLRVDTTVVETDIHYPTDSGLLGDGVRVMTRLMKRVETLSGPEGAKLRDRSRSVKLRMLEIARATRSKGPQMQEKIQKSYLRLLSSTARVLGQARQFVKQIAAGVKRAASVAGQLKLEKLSTQLNTIANRAEQVIRQTKARIINGDTHAEGKLLSLFEVGTQAIRKGKAAKPTEFGKMVKIQEAENQIVVDYEVYAKRPNDSDLLVPAIEVHERILGRTPRLVAADAGFYSSKNEKAARDKGVRRVCVPNLSTKSPERKREQHTRSFRRGQKWRVGCEGRISVLKRRHGLTRSRYRGDDGIRRWVGFGVIADNLIHIGTELAKRGQATSKPKAKGA